MAGIKNKEYADNEPNSADGSQQKSSVTHRKAVKRAREPERRRGKALPAGEQEHRPEGTRKSLHIYSAALSRYAFIFSCPLVSDRTISISDGSNCETE